MPLIKGLSTLSAQRRETNLQADTLWRFCVCVHMCMYNKCTTYNFSPVSTSPTISYSFSFSMLIHICTHTLKDTWMTYLDSIQQSEKKTLDTHTFTHPCEHTWTNKLWIWMQMSIWIKVAAGCPFRRVITLFPSMTPRDTTVTFHLSRTPEDSQRDREIERVRHRQRKWSGKDGKKFKRLH